MSANFPSTKWETQGSHPKQDTRSPKLKSSEWRVLRAAVIMKGGESPLLLMPLPVIQILVSSGPASEDCLGCWPLDNRRPYRWPVAMCSLGECPRSFPSFRVWPAAAAAAAAGTAATATFPGPG